MSLGKEDNKALEEIKVLSFWCESAGQTPSNPAPEGEDPRPLSLFKPPWFWAQPGAALGLWQLLPPARLGTGGTLRQEKGHIPPQNRGFSCFGVTGVGRQQSPALALRVSQFLGLLRAAFRIQQHP